MIIVNVKIKPKANCKQDFINEFNNLAALVRAENGCLEYELHQKLSSDSELFLFERWASKEDLDKHLTTELLSQYLVKVKELLEVKNEIIIYEAESVQ